MRGSLCASQIRLGDRSVRLGRIGYVSGWRDVPFQLLLLNQSPVSTTCIITRLPELIHLPNAEATPDGALCVQLQPFETQHVAAVLRGSLLHSAPVKEQRAWTIDMCNARNPSNTLRLHISAEVTVLQLRYTGLRWFGRPHTLSDPRNAAGARSAASSPVLQLAVAAATALPGAEGAGGEVVVASPKEDDRSPSSKDGAAADGGESGSAGASALAMEPSRVDAVLEEARRCGYVRGEDGGMLAALPLPPITCPALPSSPQSPRGGELGGQSWTRDL